MSSITTRKTIAEIISATTAQLTEKGYNRDYCNAMVGIYEVFATYCAKKQEVFYSSALGQQFLHDKYAQKHLGKSRQQVVNRALQMLADTNEFNTIAIRRRTNRELPIQFFDGCSAYLDDLRRQNRSANTIKSKKHSLHNLTEFLDGIGVQKLPNLALAHMNEYIKSALCNYCRSSAATRLRDARSFLSFLYNKGKITDDIASKLMKLPASSVPVFLPSAFKKEDVEKLLTTIDGSSPTGKRALAVILLVAKTGLRLSDMQNLKFENIDWEQYAVRITQVKTKRTLTLPLLPDVGWALINYIKHGRPVSNSQYVFLQERAPYMPLQNFDNILVKHLRLAGISTDYLRHHGLHALRHGLATTLLEQGTPLHVIQGILDHVNMDTTQKYAATDVHQLMECALEVPSL